MKKLMVLLTLMVLVFGFSASAFAITCTGCKGSAYANVPCATEQAGCLPFDYQTGVGYCTSPAFGGNHVIFPVCDCADAGINFAAGQRIGVRMTILVNGVAGEKGAYWADLLTSHNIYFSRHASAGILAGGACAAPEPAIDSFGPGAFYKSDGVTPATPINGAACTVVAANQTTVLVTDPANGYTITAADETNKLSYWRIHVPQIRIDPAVLKAGEIISVKVELLNQLTGGICAKCVAVCECTVIVAKACCSATNSCTFPYFTSLTAATPANNWWNGIAITNTGVLPGTATLYAYESDGVTVAHTAVVDVPAKGVYVNTLDQIGWSGTVTGGVRAFIEVTTTFPMEGFAMIGQAKVDGDSLGYLCRKP